jgi:hypothetical protein
MMAIGPPRRSMEIFLETMQPSKAYDFVFSEVYRTDGNLLLNIYFAGLVQ